MNEFRLFAHGVAFDPVAYLASAPLKFDGVWHALDIGIALTYYVTLDRRQEWEGEQDA
jgi:hypothetical protein